MTGQHATLSGLFQIARIAGFGPKGWTLAFPWNEKGTTTDSPLVMNSCVVLCDEDRSLRVTDADFIEAR